MAVDTLEQAKNDQGWKGKIEDVTASRGKRLRAEPVAALYGDPEKTETWDTAIMRHVGDLDELEEQMKAWMPESGESPDSMDAMVFAASDLFVTDEKEFGFFMA